MKDITPAVEEDWYTEYLDLIMAVKVVDGVDEAIAHITKYGTGHSEAIVTANYHNGGNSSGKWMSRSIFECFHPIYRWI